MSWGTVRLLARALNPILMLFGRKIIRRYIGRWRVDRETHQVRRTVYPIGWRIARRGEWEGFPDTATELDRLNHRIAAQGDCR